MADETQQFTVFAPTDDAFAVVEVALIEAVLANPDILSTILLMYRHLKLNSDRRNSS